MQTNNDSSSDNDEPVDDLPIDGGELTPEEAAQAKALEEQGDGGVDADAAADAAAAGGAADEVAQASATDDDDDAAGDPDPAAAAAPAPTPASAPAPADTTATTADPKPEAPKDFDAEAKALLKQYGEGDLEDDEYQDKLRALTREEAQFTAKTAIWEDRQQRAQTEQVDAFNAAALAWQGQHADFLTNPLHVKSMNDALVLVSQQQPGLSPQDLIEKAAQVTFEAFHYTPPTAAANDADAAAKVAKATAARVPPSDKVPPSVRTAPAAASLDPSRSSYSQLDELDISELEDAVARLPESKLEEFLRDAPGAGTRGN